MAYLLILLTAFGRAHVFKFSLFFPWIVPLVLYVKNSSPYPRSSRIPSVFYSRSFVALHFTFRSMIHFEFNSCERYKVGVYFDFFLIYERPFVPLPFVEKTIFPPSYCLYSFVKDLLVALNIFFPPVSFLPSLLPFILPSLVSSLPPSLLSFLLSARQRTLCLNMSSM